MSEGQSRYPHVFSPLRVNGTTLKNRIVRTAHGTNYPDPFVNERLIGFHEARARGGVALTILEVASVHPTSPGRFIAHDDRAVEAYGRLSERVAPHGMRLFQQLWHGGAHAAPTDGTPAWSASPIPSVERRNVPIAMTKAMIDEVLAGYAAAARRCQRGGIDGVEVHAAHGYLLSQFLSPLTNRREDDYGGSLANRARFLREALVAVREAVGPSFVVGTRLSASEVAAGGLTVADTTEIATGLVADGLVDYVNFSLGSFYERDSIVAPLHEPHGYQLPDATPIARQLAVPTMVAGRVTELSEAEGILARGDADLVSMVRATIADPDLVRKAAEGREAEIKPCIGANQGCVGGIYGPRRRLGCDVNLAVGRENRAEEPAPAAEPRRVLVAGAGPAGMEAARLAAVRGHEVVLHEARERVGGAVAYARSAPYSADFGRFCDWQERELKRLGVAVQLGSAVDPALVEAERPDVVVVATGATLRRDGFQVHAPEKRVAGADADHVFTLHDVFEGALEGRERVLVFDDLGSYEAAAASEYLLERGAGVTYAATAPRLSEATVTHFRAGPAARRLAAHAGFRERTWVSLEAIETGRVVLSDRDSGRRIEEPADAVVLVCGAAANRSLADAVAATHEVALVGDADTPANITAAIAGGHRVGLAI